LNVVSIDGDKSISWNQSKDLGGSGVASVLDLRVTKSTTFAKVFKAASVALIKNVKTEVKVSKLSKKICAVSSKKIVAMRAGTCALRLTTWTIGGAKIVKDVTVTVRK
jgi:hypothetical protein